MNTLLMNRALHALLSSLFAEARFDPCTVNVGFVVDKVLMGQEFLRVLAFFPSVPLHQYSIALHSSITEVEIDNVVK
jgi:hypothetical protein